jgi:RNA polymerase sigma factor (sigma-70 family)
MNQAQAIALYQPMLQTIAFNLLKCKEEAEDIVQETFLKWLCIDQSHIENTKAYLITAVTNSCLNHLKALRAKKVEYWDSLQLADKLGKFWEMDLGAFDVEAEVAAALKVLQRKLEPMERATYLLKDVFNVEYDALQEILDKKSDNCRQMLCRARKKLNQETDKFKFELPDTSPLLESFRKACEFGTVSDLIADLKKDIGGASQKK